MHISSVQDKQTFMRWKVWWLVQVHYEPSGAIARRLGVSARALGKVTGNFYVEEGDDKYDVGLCVKHGGRGMCVPDYVQPAPDDRGWLFSPALVQILADYKVHTLLMNCLPTPASCMKIVDDTSADILVGLLVRLASVAVAFLDSFRLSSGFVGYRRSCCLLLVLQMGVLTSFCRAIFQHSDLRIVLHLLCFLSL